MVEALTIRAASAEDEVAWVRLNQDFMREVADANPAWGTLKVPSAEDLGRVFREALAAPESIRVFVARMDGEIRAYANTWTVYSVWSGGLALTVDDLYVDPARRGHGIGEALMKHLEAYALERGCRRMQLHAEATNDRAQALYRKLGMHGEGMVFFRKNL
jgi:ribosomal protein S18 acetylase RimI-like enzyme